ncbi:MAG: hypothetical protein ACE5IH_00405 [Thermodesulfobacteriota bacterium]
MDKVICSKCKTPSYTAATTSSVSCPFCGFVPENVYLERRQRPDEIESDRRLQKDSANHSLSTILKKNNINLLVTEETLG